MEYRFKPAGRKWRVDAGEIGRLHMLSIASTVFRFCKKSRLNFNRNTGARWWKNAVIFRFDAAHYRQRACARDGFGGAT